MSPLAIIGFVVLAKWAYLLFSFMRGKLNKPITPPESESLPESAAVRVISPHTGAIRVIRGRSGLIRLDPFINAVHSAADNGNRGAPDNEPVKPEKDAPSRPQLLGISTKTKRSKVFVPTVKQMQ